MECLRYSNWFCVIRNFGRMLLRHAYTEPAQKSTTHDTHTNILQEYLVDLLPRQWKLMQHWMERICTYFQMRQPYLTTLIQLAHTICLHSHPVYALDDVRTCTYALTHSSPQYLSSHTIVPALLHQSLHISEVSVLTNKHTSIQISTISLLSCFLSCLPALPCLSMAGF